MLHIFLNKNEINHANACMVCKIIVYTKICINVHEDPHKTHMPLKSSMIGTQKKTSILNTRCQGRVRYIVMQMAFFMET